MSSVTHVLFLLLSVRLSAVKKKALHQAAFLPEWKMNEEISVLKPVGEFVSVSNVICYGSSFINLCYTLYLLGVW